MVEKGLAFCREYSLGNAMRPADVWLPKAYRLHSDSSRRQSKSEAAPLGADWSRGFPDFEELSCVYRKDSAFEIHLIRHLHSRPVPCAIFGNYIFATHGKLLHNRRVHHLHSAVGYFHLPDSTRDVCRHSWRNGRAVRHG
jgi:hypothetical protein